MKGIAASPLRLCSADTHAAPVNSSPAEPLASSELWCKPKEDPPSQSAEDLLYFCLAAGRVCVVLNEKCVAGGTHLFVCIKLFVRLVP